MTGRDWVCLTRDDHRCLAAARMLAYLYPAGGPARGIGGGGRAPRWAHAHARGGFCLQSQSNGLFSTKYVGIRPNLSQSPFTNYLRLDPGGRGRRGPKGFFFAFLFFSFCLNVFEFFVAEFQFLPSCPVQPVALRSDGHRLFSHG